MCRAEYPQIIDIIRFVNAHPYACKQRDWFGFAPIHYLSMNEKVSGDDLQMIIQQAPQIKIDLATS